MTLVVVDVEAQERINMASQRELQEVFILSYESLYEIIQMALDDDNNKYMDAHYYIEKAIDENNLTVLKI